MVHEVVASGVLPRLTAEASGAPNTDLMVTGWSQDSPPTAGIGVNADGVHFDLLAGVYIANLNIQGSAPGQTAIGAAILGVDGNYADAGPVTQQAAVVTNVMNIRGTVWFALAADGQVSVALDVGVTNVSWGAIDLVRVGT
jgi:hypothetical protein